MSLSEGAGEGSDGQGEGAGDGGGEGDSQLVHVGKITRVRGVEGEMEVAIWGGAALDLPLGSRVFLKKHEDDEPRPYLVDGVRKLGARMGLRLAGVLSPEDAKLLVGRSVMVNAGALPALPEGGYYYYQILGLSVVDTDGRALGEVAEIIETGGNDVYVVRDGAREILLPATDQVILEVDLAGGRMKVRVPPGLID